MDYFVKYKMTQFGEVKWVDVVARSKTEAYGRAVYEVIKRKENELPYSAWVHSVTYQNGKIRLFNTFEGKPY